MQGDSSELTHRTGGEKTHVGRLRQIRAAAVGVEPHFHAPLDIFVKW
jgi:hypothetical protein